MCGTPTIVGGAVGGPIGAMIGMGIEGAQGAASAAENAARNQQALAINASQMTPAQLALLDKQTEATLGNLRQQQDMLNSVNPALMELGHQTLAMLRGETTAGSSLVASQRADQKAALEERLKQQYGTGYKDTTAGMQALNNFDRQSSESMYGMATSAVPTLAGIYGQGLNNSQNAMNNLQSVYGNNTGQRINAITGTANQVIQTSGSQFATDIMLGNIGQGVAQAAISGAMGGMTGGGAGGAGAAKPSGGFAGSNRLSAG